jgi:hypothetical protein
VLELKSEKTRKRVSFDPGHFDSLEYQEELLRLKKQEMEAKLRKKE